MKTESTIKPQEFEVNKLNNFWEFSLNEDIKQITRDDETLFEFDKTYRKAKITSRDDVIVALIRLKYIQDDEYALINKGIVDSTDPEYTAYREYVEKCKNYANEII